MLKIRKAHALMVAILAGAGAVAHSVAADAPCGQYSFSDDHTTVSDIRTGLVWQRSPATNTMLWNDANIYCSSAAEGTLPGCSWRLPSAKELQTIVDDSTSEPAIDGVAFPGTGTSAYWTSTPAGPGQAWAIAFFYGFPQSNGIMDDPAAVRCVR
jgi:hypothetical protein